MIIILYYNEKNNNKDKTLVVLHGFGGNNNCFKKQFHIFDEFFNVIYIDLHSHGKSNHKKLKDKKELTFKELSKDIKEILDELNIEKVYLLGLSLGTMVIHSFMVEYKERVEGIIQIAPVISFNAFSKIALFITNKMKKYLNSNFIYIIFSYVLIPSKSYKKSREIFQNEAKKLEKEEFNLWFDVIETFPKIYTYNLLKSIEVKKLYIIGREDIMFLKQTKEYTSKDTSCKFNIVENAGHVCNIDNYLEVNNILYNYFRYELLI